jgi:anaerobic selenocysteine-containing dehydrogenase
MPERTAPTSDVTDQHLEVEKPETWAAGIPGIWHAVQHAYEEAGVTRSVRTLRRINQKDGFDCMSCAWPDPDDRKIAEFCENGAKAVAWETDRKHVERDFWTTYTVSELAERSEYWLGQQGRLTEPVHKPAGSDHYEPVSWDAAFVIVARELQGLASPD